MKRILRPFFYLFSISISILGACGKEGPVGDQGAVGPQGPRGPEGSIEVVVDSFTVSNADFSKLGTYWYATSPDWTQGYTAKMFTRQNAKITQDILDKGVVQIYFKQNYFMANTGWQSMPTSFVDNTGGKYTYNITPAVWPGKVDFFAYYMGLGTTQVPLIGTFIVPDMKIKLVIIPGKTMEAMGLNRQAVLNGTAVLPDLSLQEN